MHNHACKQNIRIQERITGKNLFGCMQHIRRVMQKTAFFCMMHAHGCGIIKQLFPCHGNHSADQFSQIFRLERSNGLLDFLHHGLGLFRRTGDQQ